MKYHTLNASTRKSRRRVGRGISAGRGKTAGRGTKGQSSRSGGKRRPGFEGGQNPLHLRLPKLPGFTSHKLTIQTVSTKVLNSNFKSNQKVDAQTLLEAKLIKNMHLPVKLLFSEAVNKKLSVELQSASRQAVESLEQAGGSFTQVERKKQVQLKEAKK